jgi:hypothetical protein
MGRTRNEDVQVKGAEENIWNEEGRSNRRLGKLHTFEIHNLYSSPNIIRTMKSMRMRWKGT